MATVQRWTGLESRALREAMRLSVRGFAAKLGVATRTITTWEARGRDARLRPDSQSLLDTAFDRATEDVRARFVELAADDDAHGDAPVPHREHHHTPGDPPSVEGKRYEQETDMHRRRFLGGLASLGLAAPVSLAGMESLRHDLLVVISGDAGDLTDWEQIAAEYSHSYFVTPPSALVDELTADLVAARQWLGRPHDDLTRRGMQRVVAQLAVFQAHTLGNLGAVRSGRRWWRIARQAADATGDPNLTTWVLGKQLIRGLYEERSPEAALRLAAESAAVTSAPAVGTVEALCGRAQAYAMLGRAAEARRALRLLADTVERLPERVVTDTTSMFGWPEYRWRHTESFVHTYLGDARTAGVAQDRALALYPAAWVRDRTQVELHRATGAVHSGDVGDGVRHARRVLSALPEQHRTGVVREVARSVLRAVPAAERKRPDVADLREMLAPQPVPGHVARAV